MTAPVLISFYTGDRAYHEAAAALASRCDALGIDHDIEHLALPDGVAWDAICRMKIAFIARKLREHGRAVFWIDVDTELLRRPNVFDGVDYDFGAFGREFRTMRALIAERPIQTFQPAFLIFNWTPGGRAFAKEMEAFERDCDERVTDDYILEACWRATKLKLDVRLLPADRVIEVADVDAAERAWFRVGRSGKVRSFVNIVEQHRPEGGPRDLARVLIEEAEDAAKAGDGDFAQKLLRRGRRIAPLDDDIFLAWLTSERRLKGEAGGRAALAGARRLRALTDKGGPRPMLFARRLFETYFELGMDAAGHDLTQEFVDDPAIGALAQSFNQTFAVERRAAAQGFAPNERASLWWRRSPYPGAFGDMLNPWIIERITGAPARYSRRKAAGLAIGPVIKFARAGTPVWGSGAADQSDLLAAGAEYHAVQGPLTRELVRKAGGKAPDIVGDPTLLVPRYFRPDVQPTNDVGFILDAAHTGLASPPPEVHAIDSLCVGGGGVERYIRQVLSCRAIVSSSLHGLIIAHAYGVPAAWLRFEHDENLLGSRLMFDDYFASVGIQDPPSLIWHARLPLARNAIEPYLTTIVRMPDLDALAGACPFRPGVRPPDLA